jgi:hypothetical protein
MGPLSNIKEDSFQFKIEMAAPVKEGYRSRGLGSILGAAKLSTIEELLDRKSSGYGLEDRENGHRDPSR